MIKTAIFGNDESLCGPCKFSSVFKKLNKVILVGLWNLLFLAIILPAVFISRPIFLREGLMFAAAVTSYFTTGQSVHEANHFNFHPIREVAVLFLGIFATMMPALDWLQANAQAVLGADPSPALVYWTAGTLSSVLDNAQISTVARYAKLSRASAKD